MRGGQNRKPAEAHVIAGTYRKDRHAQPALDVQVAVKAIKPPPGLAPSVAEEWTAAARKLAEIGVLWDIDVPHLEQAFALLADARWYHAEAEKIRRLKHREDEDWAHMLKLDRMHIEKLSAYDKFVTKHGIAASSRAAILHAMPRKKDEAKKSIKAVISK